MVYLLENNYSPPAPGYTSINHEKLLPHLHNCSSTMMASNRGLTNSPVSQNARGRIPKVRVSHRNRARSGERSDRGGDIDWPALLPFTNNRTAEQHNIIEHVMNEKELFVRINKYKSSARQLHPHRNKDNRRHELLNTSEAKPWRRAEPRGNQGEP